MADVASTIEQWSTTASSNSPSDATTIGAGLADNFQQIQATVRTALASKGADVASATTTDIGAVPGLFLDVTGTTTITGLGTIAAGIWKVLKFEGVLTLTHNATSLILPGGGNITTADGDVAIMVSEGSGNWRCVCYAGKNSYATNGKFTGTLDVTGTLTAAAITMSGDIQQNNSAYLRGKNLAGTSTRMLGISAADALFIGSIDAPLSGGISFNVNGSQWASLSSGAFLVSSGGSGYDYVKVASTASVDMRMEAYGGGTVGRIGTQSNHPVQLLANNTLALTATGANLQAAGTLGVSSTLTAVPGGTSHFNASGGRVYVAGNSSVIGLGLGYNKTRTDAAQTVFFGATDSATPDGVVSNSVGTEIVRFTNTGFVQTNGQYQIQLASVTKWQLYHDSGTSQFRIYDTNGAADAFKIATGGAITIPGTLGVTGVVTLSSYITATQFNTSTSDGIASSNANPMIMTGVSSAAGTTAIIDANGRLYKQSSSARYKENIEPMVVSDEALARFMALSPSFWDYKEVAGSLAVNQKGLASFIAEDLAALGIERNGRSVLNNYDTEGRPDSNRDAALIALQHLAIQKNAARLAAIEDEFQAYKAAHP